MKELGLIEKPNANINETEQHAHAHEDKEGEHKDEKGLVAHTC